MRLHQLEVTAFGPFATTVEVDFDALADGGLFLLCGPTGAGKSSILDAVCFALYGGVPGDRNDARHLRSDGAPPERSPRVRLETTLSGRRFRLTRSPAWDRPKKRGAGTTREQASVLVEERVDGSWTHLTGRLDEAGHLVGRLLGMTMSQFCQVVMLPQGDFQRFLKARADDRQQLLHSIFRAGRYADVEAWLRDHRLVLRRTSLAEQAGLADLVSRLSEAGSSTPPDEPVFDVPEGGFDVDALRTWAASLASDARAARVAAEAAVAPAELASDAASDALTAARTLAGAQARHADALRRHDELAHRAEAVAEARQRRDDARRAAPVRGLLTARTRALAGLERAAVAEADAMAGLGAEAHEATGMLSLDLGPPRLDLPTLRAGLENAVARRHRCSAARADDRELESLRRAARDRDDEIGRVRRQHDEALAALAALPERIVALRTEVAAATEAQTGARAALERCREVEVRLEAARSHEKLLARMSEARADHQDAVARHQAARETLLDLRERRLEGMAAEIAGQLASGGSCPVCGSCDHPHPARPAAGAPDARVERDAVRAVDTAAVTEQAYAGNVRDLTGEVAAARQAAEEQTVEHWRSVLAETRAAADDLGGRASGLDDLTRRLEQAEARLGSLQAEVADDDRTATRLAAEQTAGAARIRDLERRLTVLLSGEGARTLAEALTALASAEQRWRSAVEAAEAHERAGAAADEAHTAALEAAAEAGFDDLAAVESATLPSAEVDRLEADLRTHDDAVAATTQALADPDLIAAAQQPAPALGALEQAARDAAAVLAARRSGASVAASTAQRLGRLASDLVSALDAWLPTRASYDVADRVATLAAGSSADNRLRMRLSAYVVAWRLAQVVEAANVRLAPMTGRRYALEQSTATTGAGRGGLGLQVRDEWSGELRDPATLSGGETFVVSLALALGLADVVTSESAADGEGTDVDTLFVDEGFGSLDPDTLDDVMDTLDALRDGGRVVGVVSHVAELRTRIPVQLHVTPDRAGSRVALVHDG
ncbi:AAA family ATPase [Nocardioides alkalitolerans]|uniref:AAA family ATPase n=1 Tax=Nocardioides alkalitolerans TaxID=281714 RepID=UPI0004062727|nr:SMC family ATPase [Nocardioides alkalitolerans]